MAIDFETIMSDLANGELTVEAAGRLIASEVRQDPQRTRFWPQRIETELGQGRLAPSAARSLLDALEDFRPDQTLWIDPVLAPTRVGEPAQPQPAAPASPFAAADPPPMASPEPGATGSTAGVETPGAGRPSSLGRAAAPMRELEELRAALFGPITRPLVRTSPPAPEQTSAGPVQQHVADAERRVGAEIAGRYRLTAYMGLAGAGQVFEAADLKHKRIVTLKLIAVNLRSQPGVFADLAAAARRSQSLQHPNIAELYDIDRDGDEVFVTMEPLRGRWLSQLVREVRGRGLVYERAWPIVSGVAMGLAHAHARGVLHQNLNPHSILLSEGGEPKIVGFGLMHAAPGSNESLDVLDTQTLRAYSEAYTADPSAASGSSHPADDLYPLGVIAYELLTGHHPFQRCSLLQARQKGLRYAPIPGLPKRAVALIERCLSFERETRPRDARVFVRRMQRGMLKRLFAPVG